MSRRHRIVVIGAGVGGVVAAIELARRGCEVVVVEKASAAGGKMREIDIAGHRVDAGPTVLTMRWVFEEIFASAGASLADQVGLVPAEILARHAWGEDQRLDLYPDVRASADEVGRLAGAAEARRFLEFCARARATYETLERPFILASQPSPTSLAMGAGLRGLGNLWRISPFTTLWSALGTHFRDARLRQLFGRYATYCGSSPFDAPATLMLVAHVERQGVWLVRGGMHRLAAALANLAVKQGATLRYSAEAREIVMDGGRAARVRLASGEELAADAIIVNADPAALTRGFFGQDATRAVSAHRAPRSLSAVTWALLAKADGFPLVRHNVFFSNDYRAEFDDIFRFKRLPSAPTVYVCAQDRDGDASSPAQADRLLVLVNAPPTGDIHTFGNAEIEQCRERAFSLLSRCGASIQAQPEMTVTTTPSDFNRMFPGSGGALYGQASHGWTASFTRPTAQTHIPGLYLAGGCTHPGPGVPMAAISGRLAAAQVLVGLASTSQSRMAVTSGGTSTRSATTANTR